MVLETKRRKRIDFDTAKTIVLSYCATNNINNFSVPYHGDKIRKKHPDLTPGILGAVVKWNLKNGIFERISIRRYHVKQYKEKNDGRYIRQV